MPRASSAAQLSLCLIRLDQVGSPARHLRIQPPCVRETSDASVEHRSNPRDSWRNSNDQLRVITSCRFKTTRATDVQAANSADDTPSGTFTSPTFARDSL